MPSLTHSLALTAAFAALTVPASVLAQGKLTPPGAPEPTMYSLEDLWYRIGDVETKATALQTDTQKIQAATSALQTSTQKIQTATADLQTRTTALQTATTALQTKTDSLQTQLTETQTMLRQLVSASGSLPPAKMEVVDSTGDVGQYASFAYGPDGNPAIAYYDATNADLKFARYNGTTWQISVVDSEGDVGQYASLAFGSDGQPAIAYVGPPQLSLYYTRFDGTNWVKQTVAGYCPSSVSLKFDPTTNQPAIAFGGVLAEYAGSSWQTTSVYSGDYIFSALAFGTDGQPTIAYFQMPLYDCVLKKRDAATGTWQETFRTRCLHVNIPSLAYSPSGLPAVSFVSNYGAQYSWYDGSSWQTYGMNVPLAYGATSLAFAGEHPVFAYFNSTIGDLVLFRYNGTTWQQQTVDSLGTVGDYPSLAVRLSDNQIGIAYYDATNGDLKFVRY
ncbi:MAG TPA: hypothetical protein VK178_13930 [Opitutaceae bacterium]|nr:hypothetical protein [Opitutaceae bacterium]